MTVNEWTFVLLCFLVGWTVGYDIARAAWEE